MRAYIISSRVAAHDVKGPPSHEHMFAEELGDGGCKGPEQESSGALR
jgi:hypothetical protein